MVPDISRIMTAVKDNISHLDSKRLTIMPSMQSDQIGHWSHLSDLSSQGTPVGCTTVCDICYLKRLLIHIRMILIYHNENVTLPIQHNKKTGTALISLQHIVELSFPPHNYDHATTLVCQWSTYPHHTQRHISGHLKIM